MIKAPILAFNARNAPFLAWGGSCVNGPFLNSE
jgi:hypothetical protein